MAEWLTPEQFKRDAQVGAQVLKQLTAEKLETSDEGSRRIKFVVSTGDVDRDNDVIDPSGWDLSSYKNNPVVLWAHSHTVLPIGKCVSIAVEASKLVAVAEFAQHPFAETVFQLLKGGFMKATSVGFRALEYAINEERRGVDFKRQELLEFSVVPVPANQHALMVASAAGVELEPLRAWMQDVIEAWPGDLRLKGKAWEKLGGDTGNTNQVTLTTTIGDVCIKATAPTAKEATDALAGATNEATPAWGETTGKLESQLATLSERLASIGDQLAALRGTEETVEERGIVPRDVSRGKADQGDAWSAPRLRDFTSEPWVELGASARRRIAGHYAWSAAMPPVALADLKLPHHRASDGAVVFRGVAAAAGRLTSADIPQGDREAVRAHLARHYRQFGSEAPWERDADGWAKAEADAQVAEAEADVVAILERCGFGDESKALLETGESTALVKDDALYVELLDDDKANDDEVVLELADEGDAGIDAEALRASLREVVSETIGAIVADEVTRAVNKVRGRLD